MPDQDPDLWARRASSFGCAAREYAEHRPDYAAEAIAWCLAGAGRVVDRVLDLAAGTGALTGGGEFDYPLLTRAARAVRDHRPPWPSLSPAVRPTGRGAGRGAG